jgi:hypothetical protein
MIFNGFVDLSAISILAISLRFKSGHGERFLIVVHTAEQESALYSSHSHHSAHHQDKDGDLFVNA